MQLRPCIIVIKTLRWRHNDHAGVSNHQPHGCLLNRLFRRTSKKTSKLRVTGLCAGNSPGTGEFPAQMASYAENVSIWWRHHDQAGSLCLYLVPFVQFRLPIWINDAKGRHSETFLGNKTGFQYTLMDTLLECSLLFGCVVVKVGLVLIFFLKWKKYGNCAKIYRGRQLILQHFVTAELTVTPFSSYVYYRWFVAPVLSLL